ncbi:MAG: aminotransferase class I/II-fold pyridoxal phosphate-dependent enzyme, partial [Candidatus Accumulibacter sp.]|nr:aminotransferase class I/II-fold pyridoxal phosphate-dependent enzyme [Accumulibacter sp.]
MNKTDLAQETRSRLIDRILGKKLEAGGAAIAMPPVRAKDHSSIPEAFTRFDRHPGYEKMLVPRAAADRFGLRNPFFIAHEGVAGAVTRIEGREYLNFSSYNYLGLSGHPDVNRAAKDAIDRYGTSVSASRLVAGERPIQRELEEALAELYEVEDCVVFVSGHATNESTIGYLFGPRDLVVHDNLIHNSVLEGIKLAGSARRSFPHNDMMALDAILAEIRGRFERALVVVEGHYSMDGDLPDLQALIGIKRRHRAFLMVDEAHALGVLGRTGRGLHEHLGISGRDVDIWMGTLSKTLAGCGGYIAGERALVEHLKYAAPGFVYSVGIAPPLAAASLAALRIMSREPERVSRLQE